MARMLVVSMLAVALVGCSTVNDLWGAQHSDYSSIRAYLLPDDGCPLPCILGVEVGATTIDDARHTLQSHAWVAEFATDYGYGPSGYFNTLETTYTWAWSGSQPSWLQGSGSTGTAWKADGQAIMRDMRIHTTITIAESWRILGVPEQGHFMPRFDAPPTTDVHGGQCEHALYAGFYNGGALLAIAWVPTPLTPESFWSEPVDIRFYPPGESYGLGGWIDEPYVDDGYCLIWRG